MFKLSALCAVLSGPALAAGLVIEVAGEQSKGTVTIDLFEQIAPQHVERLTTLASAGAYDDVCFTA